MKHHKQSPLKKKTLHIGKNVFWFLIGVILGLFLLISFTYISFTHIYENKVYPGIYIANLPVGGKSLDETRHYFVKQNAQIAKSTITFTYKDDSATISAKEIGLGYDENLLAQQAYSIGRSKDVITNISIIAQAYMNTIQLPIAYDYDERQLQISLTPIAKSIYKEPIDALFNFQNGKVSAFRLSEDGQDIDIQAINKILLSKTKDIIAQGKTMNIIVPLPIMTVKPAITTNAANSFGITEEIGEGESMYHHSIQTRIYNIALAASRVNGILVAPNEEFSFDKVLGDVSAFTGYKQAYVIQNGRTVLGDGGGVCQVSTTLFRALLHAGLPITERTAHAYRVGYYEEDSPPGIDATIYVPTVDLKFINDTGHYILIQNVIDQDNLTLTFRIYGTGDGRKVVMTTPVVTKQTPAPDPLYQDDPTLPKGVVNQVDFAAAGATVSFHRTVTRDGKTLIDESYISDYRPWQAVYMRGTKE